MIRFTSILGAFRFLFHNNAIKKSFFASSLLPFILAIKFLILWFVIKVLFLPLYILIFYFLCLNESQKRPVDYAWAVELKLNDEILYVCNFSQLRTIPSEISIKSRAATVATIRYPSEEPFCATLIEFLALIWLNLICSHFHDFQCFCLCMYSCVFVCHVCAGVLCVSSKQQNRVTRSVNLWCNHNAN